MSQHNCSAWLRMGQDVQASTAARCWRSVQLSQWPSAPAGQPKDKRSHSDLLHGMQAVTKGTNGMQPTLGRTPGRPGASASTHVPATSDRAGRMHNGSGTGTVWWHYQFIYHNSVAGQRVGALSTACAVRSGHRVWGPQTLVMQIDQACLAYGCFWHCRASALQVLCSQGQADKLVLVQTVLCKNSPSRAVNGACVLNSAADQHTVDCAAASV